MSINLRNTASVSFLPGIQNSGQVSGTALVSGTLYPSPNVAATNTSNLIGGFIIRLDDPTVISQFRVNLPDAHGHLASRWFPLTGTAELTDNTAHWRLILYVTSTNSGQNSIYFQGRQVLFNFVNLQDATTTFTNFRISIYGHLFSYPWSQTS